ncbi:MAG: tRNA-dihydrouridine synthase family protein [Deltaproteobacteria bacterium]|nr:MAG: tRNA-dihydrouridine synthase family protein [Deltaproteobacteria bacterium]
MKPGPFYIRNLRVEPPLILAPMAGLTHTAFRQLVAECGGCGLFYTEMLSARSLPFETPHCSPWLQTTERERPLMYQLLVSEPEELPAAIEKVESCGADGIDLNMGCATALIVKRGGGVALMKDPRRAEAISKTARRHTNLPLTAKIRLGWRLDWTTLRDFCLMLQASGIDAVTVHPRLKGDRLNRPARWTYITKIKELLDIPVIGNGDVDSPETAFQMVEQTKCDAVMIGRASVRQPWLFRQIATALFTGFQHQPEPEPPMIYHRFASLLRITTHPERQLRLLKEFTFYFARNYAFGHTLWSLVHNADSLDNAVALAEDFFQQQRPKPSPLIS